MAEIFCDSEFSIKKLSLRRRFFPFVFLLLLSSFCISTHCSSSEDVKAERVSHLQYEIGWGKDSLAKPTISWIGNLDTLLIDQKTIFYWKKKKLIQIKSEQTQDALNIAFSNDGSSFVCSDNNNNAYLGNSSELDLEPLKEKVDAESIKWNREGSYFLFIRNLSLFQYYIRRNYTERIIENVSDFFVSSDDSRLIARVSGNEDDFASASYILTNYERSLKGNLPRGGIFIDKRGNNPFIKNVSNDFRRIVYEKQPVSTNPYQGFILGRIDWKNFLFDSKRVLDEFKGNQDAAFSPDMNMIALSCKDKAGQSYMVVLSSSGDILSKFSLKKGWIYQDPLWSPSGDRIIWKYIDMTKPEGERTRLLLTDPRGLTIQFIPVPCNTSELYWSPKSDQIIVRDVDRFLQPGNYYVYDLKDKNLKEIFRDKKNRATSRPCWSPDGKYIAIIDYSTFQKREKKTEIINGVSKEKEKVYFREQVLFYKPSDDTMQLIW